MATVNWESLETYRQRGNDIQHELVLSFAAMPPLQTHYEKVAGAISC